MAVMAGTRGLKTFVGEYDFAVDGGAAGTIVLRSESGPIPSGAVVVGGFADVTTACLSGSGTIALKVEGAGDLVAAAGQASWTTGRKSLIPDFTGANSVKTTQERSPSLVIATAAFTAGKLRLVLVYI